MLYLVEDQLNLGKVRKHGSRVCYLLLVMQDQILFWGPLDPMVDRGLRPRIKDSGEKKRC